MKTQLPCKTCIVSPCCKLLNNPIGIFDVIHKCPTLKRHLTITESTRVGFVYNTPDTEKFDELCIFYALQNTFIYNKLVTQT